jgi:iron complex transport system substrate-binding protein
LIVLADTKCCGQTAATVKSRPGWSSIRAVQQGNVVAASDDVTSRWGPRIVDFVRVVAAAIRRAGR